MDTAKLSKPGFPKYGCPVSPLDAEKPLDNAGEEYVASDASPSYHSGREPSIVDDESLDIKYTASAPARHRSDPKLILRGCVLIFCCCIFSSQISSQTMYALIPDTFPDRMTTSPTRLSTLQREFKSD